MTKKSVRFMISILLVAVMLATCVACGSNGGGGKTPDSKTEAATTAKPEEVTTEKVEVDIDPETYEWSDDEKIVYFDDYEDDSKDIKGEYFKKFDSILKEQDTVFCKNINAHKEMFCYDEPLITINNFVKFVYECDAIAEGLNGSNGIIGYTNEKPVEEPRKWNECISVTYIKGNDTYYFYSKGKSLESTGYLRKMNSENEVVWEFPLSSQMRDHVAEFIEFSAIIFNHLS